MATDVLCRSPAPTTFIMSPNSTHITPAGAHTGSAQCFSTVVLRALAWFFTALVTVIGVRISITAVGSCVSYSQILFEREKIARRRATWGHAVGKSEDERSCHP